MSSMLRTRFGIPGLIATVALVFAMTGGAFAAKYLITSTKQISPSVLKKLKGKAGPAGAPGAPGAQGPAGPAGAAGKEGAKGATGEAGAKGATGPTGKAGVAGKAGSPWTAGGTLPSEATETGAWILWKPFVTDFEARTSLSFAIPLSAGLDEEHVHYVNAAGQELIVDPVTEEAEFVAAITCLGTATAPSAPPGNLCVYVGVEGGPMEPAGTINPLVGNNSIGGASTAGAVVRITGDTGLTVKGSWAVTAP